MCRHGSGAPAQAKPFNRGAAGCTVTLSLSVRFATLADHPDSDSVLIAADRELYAAKALVHAERSAA